MSSWFFSRQNRETKRFCDAEISNENDSIGTSQRNERKNVFASNSMLFICWSFDFVESSRLAASRFSAILCSTSFHFSQYKPKSYRIITLLITKIHPFYMKFVACVNVFFFFFLCNSFFLLFIICSRGMCTLHLLVFVYSRRRWL